MTLSLSSECSSLNDTYSFLDAINNVNSHCKHYITTFMIYIFRHREADELKLKISKFKSGISMLQERGLWATQQQLQKVKNFYNTVKNNLNES